MTCEILPAHAMAIKKLWIAQFCAEFLNKGDDAIRNGFDYGSHPDSNEEMYLLCTFLFLRNSLISMAVGWPLGVYSRPTVPGPMDRG